MSPVNKVKKKKEIASHLNYMGGRSFAVSDPLLKLRLAASCTFFGEPKYYLDSDDKSNVTRAQTLRLDPVQIKHLRETLNAIDPQDWRGMRPQDLMETVIDAALDHDPGATLEYAAGLRNEENIRVTPQVILVRAAHHANVRGTNLIRTFARRIIKRADEPATGLSYQLSCCGERAAIPNSLKRAWAEALEGFSEYELAKYRMQNRQVKTIDVVNLVHAKSDAINKLMRGQLSTTDLTWESIISRQGSNTESWSKAFEVMGHMAALRNCRNLLEQGFDPALLAKKLLATADSGKQLPFRYFSACKAVRESAPLQVLAAIEECLLQSTKRLPKFSGRTMSLCDNSGSAQGATTSSMGKMKVSTIGNLTGLLVGMRSDEGYVGLFGDMLKRERVTSSGSVLKQLEQLEKAAVNVGLSTETGIWLFFEKAIGEREHWDQIFVFSDMQAGHGGLYGSKPDEYQAYAWNGRYIDVAKLIKDYRQQVNPLVMVYLIQTAGYVDTLVPEFYDRTYILSGWGEGIFRFAAQMRDIGQPA